MAVIGPSGCGKSSLVRAGLLPGLASGALGTGSNWRLALFRPGGQPMLALAQALLGKHALGHELVGKGRVPKDTEDFTADVALVAAELRCGIKGLQTLLTAANTRRLSGSQHFNLLILVDQFEELFTYADAQDDHGDESMAFVDFLLAAHVNIASNVYVAITMRTDFLGNCVKFLKLPESINRGLYLTPRLNESEMRGAITGPTRVFGGSVQPELTEQLVRTIGSSADQLPLLQHALARMWQTAIIRNANRPKIDLDCLNKVGGVAAILSTYCS